MTDAPDADLLTEFARNNSESAFAALVQRHVNLVYSAALRQTGNPAASEEITQAVFIILARKAGSLSRKTVVPGWLFQTARLTAANYQRSESRRIRREQEAYMQSTLEETAPDDAWREMAPLLDDAMARLGTHDRDALVLRFFENKSLQEIGETLGIEERAAQKRVSRALDKLRSFFAKRGVVSTTAVIAGAMSAHSVHAAPMTLTQTISTVAITKGAAAGGSTITLVKGAMKVMAWTKAKAAIAISVGVLLATGTTAVIVEKIAHPKLSATDVSWADNPKYWELNSDVLSRVPAGVFIFRPTRFPNSGGSVSMGQRLVEKNYNVHDLIGSAYLMPYTRTIFPKDLPSAQFDVMSTLSEGGWDVRIQQELRNRFDISAHRETRLADVLLLKVKDANPPNLKSHGVDDGNSFWSSGNYETTIRNVRLASFLNNIESTVGQPVIDQTELTNRYDLYLDAKPRARENQKNAFRRALLEQLGLELTPARMPIEMLVVEKVK